MMRRHMRWFVLVAAQAAVAGCSSTSPQPRVLMTRTERSSYAPGDSVRMSITNVSGQVLGPDFCSADLERGDGVNWITVASVGFNACLFNGAPVFLPGSVDTVTFVLPQGLSAGLYCYAFTDVEESHGTFGTLQLNAVIAGRKSALDDILRRYGVRLYPAEGEPS